MVAVCVCARACVCVHCGGTDIRNLRLHNGTGDRCMHGALCSYHPAPMFLSGAGHFSLGENRVYFGQYFQ